MIIQFNPILTFKHSHCRFLKLSCLCDFLYEKCYVEIQKTKCLDETSNKYKELDIWGDMLNVLYSRALLNWIDTKRYCNNDSDEIAELNRTSKEFIKLLKKPYLFKFELLKETVNILLNGKVSKDITEYFDEKIKEEKIGNYQKGIIGTTEIFDKCKNFLLNINKKVSIPMIFVKGGEFEMGNNDDNFLDEKPVHRVNLNDFWIGKYPLTQEQWDAVISDSNENSKQYKFEVNKFKGIYYPVENISWEEADFFCKTLMNKYAPEGYRFDLPTEAQWEFAAKGGINDKRYKYSGSNILQEVAWYYENSGDEYFDDTKWDLLKLYKDKNKEVVINGYSTHPVGTKKPNILGIHDMSGNVSEWCRDHAIWNNDKKTVITNTYEYKNVMNILYEPYCAIGTQRIRRGGSWANSSKFGCSTTNRQCRPPSFKAANIGFRLALVAK